MIDSDSSQPFKNEMPTYGSLKKGRDCDYVTLDGIYAQVAENVDWKFANFNKVLLRYFKRSIFRMKFIMLRTLTFLLIFIG